MRMGLMHIYKYNLLDVSLSASLIYFHIAGRMEYWNCQCRRCPRLGRLLENKQQSSDDSVAMTPPPPAPPCPHPARTLFGRVSKGFDVVARGFLNNQRNNPETTCVPVQYGTRTGTRRNSRSKRNGPRHERIIDDCRQIV